MADLFQKTTIGNNKVKRGVYTAHDIEVLEGLEPVRRRPGMYIGGSDEAAMYYLISETLDNAMDGDDAEAIEAAQQAFDDAQELVDALGEQVVAAQQLQVGAYRLPVKLLTHFVRRILEHDNGAFWDF